MVDSGLLTRMFRSLGPLTLRCQCWRMQTTDEEAVVHGLTLREGVTPDCPGDCGEHGKVLEVKV